MNPLSSFSRCLPALAALVLTATAQTFTNPIIYSDFPDNDVFTGPDGAFYFSASNFHYSPSAPILRSEDLVNWELIGHSIPRFSPEQGAGYDLVDGQAYRGGTWASTLRYRESNGLWYWIGCINFYNTHVYTASSPEGPWGYAGTVGEAGTCYYDCGLLIDEDGTMYVVYGAEQVLVAELADNENSGNGGLVEVQSENVFSAEDVGVDTIEGNRLYKIDGLYYVLNDRPGGTTYIWKSESPFGPYEYKVLVEDVTPPVAGGNSPHQGSLIETAQGDWYFMSFTWAYPAGRLPVLAPITWGDDGFPEFVNGDNGGWGEEYPLPLPEQVPETSWERSYTFEGPDLEPTWEWNHDPDEDFYEVDSGLTLYTVTVTDDLYAARNTLTHRLNGEFPVGTLKADISSMADGDHFGLAAFRDRSASIGIRRDGDDFVLQVVHGMEIDEEGGDTVDTGSVVAEDSVPEGTTEIWFRTEMDVRPNGDKIADFFYSFDGEEFSELGESYELYDSWMFFLGYRFGIFNYATQDLGGSVTVEEFSSA